MFYFKYFIQIADLHFWHYQLKYHIYTAFIPEQESRQSEGKHRESNPETDVTPQCQARAVLSWGHHIHCGSNEQRSVQISQAIKMNFQMAPFLQQGREGVKCNCRKLFSGDSRRENWAYRYQSEVLVSNPGHDIKGNYEVCHSTVFVFQLSSTAARKCKLLSGDEEIRSRSPCPSSDVQPRVIHVMSDSTSLRNSERSSMQVWRTQMHCLQRWQTCSN